jgi:hypothetical protein
MNQPHLPVSLYNIDVTCDLIISSRKVKDGDFIRFYDSYKISGATNIGMPKGYITSIPLFMFVEAKMRGPEDLEAHESEDVKPKRLESI